jgi:hypothetical protein
MNIRLRSPEPHARRRSRRRRGHRATSLRARGRRDVEFAHTRRSCSVAASDSHLVTRVVERHEPVWLGPQPFPRAQDNDGTHSERFAKPEDRQRVATIAAVFICDVSRRFMNRVLKSVSPSHKRLALSGQSLPPCARCHLLSLELFEPIFTRCPPGLRIGPQGLRKRQKSCEFCTQLPLILTPGWRPSHMFV